MGGFSVARYTPERARLVQADRARLAGAQARLAAAHVLARAVVHRHAAGLLGHPGPSIADPRRPVLLPAAARHEHRYRRRSDDRHHLAGSPHPARARLPVLYGISVVLVLAVLSPLGQTVNGAHAWIVIGGGFSLQPSEFTKITIILGMAMILASRVDAGDQAHPDHRTVAKSLGVAAIPILIIMLMPDLGSVMVIAMIVLGVLLASGAAKRWVWVCSARVCSAASGSGRPALLDEYQIARFAAFANPALDPRASATTPTRPGSRSVPAD